MFHHFILKGKKALFFIIIASTFLTACATCPAPKEVKVPVAVPCPTPQIPPKPHLPIADIKPNSPPNTVIQAYAASVKLLQGYSNQLIALLHGYQKQ